MPKRNSRFSHCCALLFIALCATAPALAQYSNHLAGVWGTPATANITNIVMDRLVRRRVQKRSGNNRQTSINASRTVVTEADAPPSDGTVRFRSTGTQLKTREIANLFAAPPDPNNQKVFAILQALLQEFDKSARAAGRPDDLALAISFFFATNASIYHDRGQPSDPQMLELRDIVAEALVEANAFNGVSDRQKQEMYEVLVLYTGFALVTYQEGKQLNNAASLKISQQLAGMNLQAVTGISPDKIDFTDQGLSIEGPPTVAGNPAATQVTRVDSTPRESDAGAAIAHFELIRQYDTNEIAADNNYKGRRVRVSGPFSQAVVEQGKMLVWFAPTAYYIRLGCFFDNSERSSVAQLKAQQTFVVEGTMRGIVSPGRLVMDNCVLK